MSHGRSLLIGLALVSFFCFPLLSAAPPRDLGRAQEQLRKFHELEAERAAARFELEKSNGVQPSQNLDVLHYDLDLRLDPQARTVSGTVTMRFSPTAALGQVRMRLYKSLQVTGADLDGQPVTPLRKGADVTFTFSSPLSQGSPHDLRVQYAGNPVTTSGLGGGMVYGSHLDTPVAASLSEPFDSYAWWPCVDDVKDKATMDMALTVPEGMVGTSNGTLVQTTTNSDGWVTYKWHESYPISNYLICASVTNYAHFADAYTSLDGSREMPLDYYVYPEHVADARALFVRVPDMIHYYATLAGEYPFVQEKYGMVAFPWGGGMEHQTLTSMYDACTWGADDQDGIYAHELAHQWWGDAVTCGTWNDIWLNEGFATYYEALWLCVHYEMSEGDMLGWYYDDGLYAGQLGGTVYVANGNNPFKDSGAIYQKGAWVLHMLKKVMGEDAFDAALRDYRAAHEGGNAVTGDLKAACEGRYGKSLAWFFDEWVYTPKRPIYQLTFTQGAGSVAVTIAQKQPHKIANRTTDQDVYIMPVDLTLHFQDGTTQTVTVQNDQRTQTFALDATGPVRYVALDEENWILKVVK